MSPASAEVDLLERADGSGRWTSHGYQVLAAVSGPIEVQRRDELPEEAVVDVVVRPAAGVAAIRERHFESLIQRVLRRVIRTKSHPRTLIQVTLQVTSTPENTSATGRLPQSASNLPLLPVLLNATLLALLTTTIPLKTTYAAGIFAIDDDKNITADITTKDTDDARSLHVLCLSRSGDTLLAESEGKFKLDEWIHVVEQGRKDLIGHSASNTPGGMDIDTDAAPSLALVRKTVLARLEKHEAWRQAG